MKDAVKDGVEAYSVTLVGMRSSGQLQLMSSWRSNVA